MHELSVARVLVHLVPVISPYSVYAHWLLSSFSAKKLLIGDGVSVPSLLWHYEITDKSVWPRLDLLLRCMPHVVLLSAANLWSLANSNAFPTCHLVPQYRQTLVVCTGCSSPPASSTVSCCAALTAHSAGPQFLVLTSLSSRFIKRAPPT